MIKWIYDNISSGELLVELYCGSGNFTLPLSKKFINVIATEISKLSIKAANENKIINNINNIKFVRMSSKEFSEAMNKTREFKRLKEQNITLLPLNNYKNPTILVDPPRAGLDEITINILKNFSQIIYVSCNIITLKRDLKQLTKTYNIKKVAFFDQFAYSSHIETGVILYK
jgi:tRNA (uracil-5-)-methyltransferase